VAGDRRRYTDDDRSSALAKLAENGGDVSKTARELGIPPQTLRQWRDGKRHPEALQQSEGKKSELADRYERLTFKALRQAEKGIPKLGGRDASVVAGIFTDKMLLLRGDTPPAATLVIKVMQGVSTEDL
jgi:transposase-like protein